MKKFMLGALVLMTCQNFLIKAGDMPSNSELEAKIRELEDKLWPASSDRKDFMRSIGRCRGFEKIAQDKDFVAAGVLAANPDMLGACPALFGVGKHLDTFEKCMVRNLAKISELHAKPALAGSFMAKIGLASQPYANNVYRVALGIEYACKHPKEYPDVYEGLDDDAGHRL